MAKKKTIEDYQKEVKHLKKLIKDAEDRRAIEYQNVYYRGNEAGQNKIREEIKNILEIRELPET